MNVGFLAMMYSKMMDGRDGQKHMGYRCWSMTQARWLLGDNKKLGSRVSFMVGYGKRWPTRIYDRASSCPGGGRTCSMTDKNTDQANPHTFTGALIFGPDWLQDKIVDERNNDNNDTMVRLDWNGGLPGLFSGLKDVGGSWAECLQGYGAKFRYHPICNPI